MKLGAEGSNFLEWSILARVAGGCCSSSDRHASTMNRERQWFKRSPFSFSSKSIGHWSSKQHLFCSSTHKEKMPTAHLIHLSVLAGVTPYKINVDHCSLLFRRGKAARLLGWWWQVGGFHLAAVPLSAPLVPQTLRLAHTTYTTTQTERPARELVVLLLVVLSSVVS